MSWVSGVRRALVASALGMIGIATAQAQDTCPGLRLGSVGWLDAGASASLVSALVRGLGYEVSVQRLSAPVIFNSLKSRDLDATMEVMVPTMGDALKPYLLDDSVSLLRKNLSGTKYSLATNDAGAALGITSFQAIGSHGPELMHRIIGIEEGSDGNLLIDGMIRDQTSGLEDFSLVEGTEQELRDRVIKANESGQPVVFLAWEPHPMNLAFRVHWLTGGDDVFGTRFGGADVYTGVRAALERDCGNLYRLLSSIEFDLDMINEVMAGILDLGARPLVAAIAWMRQNPERIDPWMEGVTDREGGDGRSAVKSFMGLGQ